LGGTLGARGARRAGDGIDPPGAGHALQLSLATILEPESRARRKVPHGARDEELAYLCGGHDAGRGGHGDTGDLLTALLHFADVEARSDLDAEPLDCLDRVQGTIRSGGGGIEDGEESVAGGVHLASAVML